MKAAEEYLLIFEGASAGQHVAAGAAWVDLPQANPSGRASRERASQYPQWSRPSEQRHKNRQMLFSPPGCGDPSQWPQILWLRGVARGLCRLGALLARPLLRIRYGSPLRGCSCQAALPAAHGLPGSCFASVTASRNGLYVIYSALPNAGHAIVFDHRKSRYQASGFPICSQLGLMNFFRGQILLLLNCVNTMCLSLEAPVSIGLSGGFVSVNGPLASVRHQGSECSVKHLFPIQTHSLPIHSHTVPQSKNSDTRT